MRAAAVPLFSVENHVARRRVRRRRVQPFGRAHLHERAQHARPRRHPDPLRRARARPTRSSSRAGTAPSTPSRWPTSSTPSCSATARRSSASSTRWWPAGKQSGSASRRRPARRTRRTRGGLRPAPLRRRATPTAGSPAGDPAAGAPAMVGKRTIADLAEWPYPRHQLVPLTEVVHDRLNVEVFRGCTRGCRFCQAGMITRPVRERPAEQVRKWCARGSRGPATTRSR